MSTCILGPRAEVAGNARHSLKRQGKGSAPTEMQKALKKNTYGAPSAVQEF